MTPMTLPSGFNPIPVGRFIAGALESRTGNVWRWMQFNTAFKKPNDFFVGPYGLRGGAWYGYEENGRASFRGCLHPVYHYYVVGFSPVVVRQDSQV